MAYSINRCLHIAFYVVTMFIVIAVLFMPLSIAEKIVHTYAWLYIVWVYAYFFDEKPPKIFRIEYLYGTAKKEYHKEYVERVIILSQHSLALMRKIQMNEDYQVVNQSISDLERRYKQLMRLIPPDTYHESHLSIVQDVKAFLDSLENGDYYLVQQR